MNRFLFLLLFGIVVKLNLKAQLNEGFETNLSFPAGWTTFIGTNGLGTAQSWQVQSNGPHSGSNNAYLQYEVVAGGTSEDWLVTSLVPITTSNFSLTFWEKETYAVDYNTVYSVRVSTTSQTNQASFSSVVSYTEELTSPLVYRNRVVDLSAFIGQSVYIAFVMTQNDGDDWFLDDINLVGNCSIAPTNLNFTSVSYTTATVNYSAGQTGSTFFVTYTDGISAPISQVVTGTSLALNSLVPGATYNVTVSQICSAGDTSSIASDFFTTTCPALTVPWSEGFESVNVINVDGPLPYCWDRKGDFYTGNGNQSFYRSAHSGTKYMYDYWDALDTVSTPLFMLTPGTYDFSFYYAADNFVWDSMSVELVQHLGPRILLDKVFSISDTSYNQMSLQFSVNTTNLYRLSILLTGSSTPWYYRFDDFNLHQLTNVPQYINTLKLSLFPNPVADILNVSANNGIEQIQIADQLGKALISTNQSSVNVANLASGVYLVIVKDVKGNTKQTKFIKQ